MERLSHDLNLALEESNCGRSERRKLGLRRRTRSAGNLPAAVSVSLVEEGSSSSPPQAPLVSQPLSDSDDAPGRPTQHQRYYCTLGNFESDSFNENFSPTRPANARRKRKFKKMPVEYMDGKQSPPIEILSVTAEPNAPPLPATAMLQSAEFSPLTITAHKHKAPGNPDRNAFCGKRKWSHRDKDVCEMRERSFSGGCSSKSTFFSKNDFKSKKYDSGKRKDIILQPGKIVLKPETAEGAKSFTTTPSLPGSSSFNFVYKNCSKNGAPTLARVTGYKVATHLPPAFSPTTSTGRSTAEGRHHRKLKMLSKHGRAAADGAHHDMECVGAGGTESSSLSSSDSGGAPTDDSDREGDDELTDWPGIEELKVFNRSLTFKCSTRAAGGGPGAGGALGSMPPPKRLKKEKALARGGAGAGCKNKHKKKRATAGSEGDDDAMSDTRIASDAAAALSSFGELRRAAEAGFFQSFHEFEQRRGEPPASPPAQALAARDACALHKTSSSDMNASERSPASDLCSEGGGAGDACGAGEVREIRAGCRRVRDERPGLLILSAASAALARFLQDASQAELRLPAARDPAEARNLRSLAQLYSLELHVEMGRPVLRKTSNTMRATRVEHYCYQLPADHKRRCYGGSPLHAAPPPPPPPPHTPTPDTFSRALIDNSLLHPGDVD